MTANLGFAVVFGLVCVCGAAAVDVTVAMAQLKTTAGASPQDTLHLNAQAYTSLAHQAASAKAAFVVYPEFGLFGGLLSKCQTPQDDTPLCEPMPIATGDVPCTNAALSSSPTLVAMSCTAANASIAMSVNMCETGSDGNNYNTQVVFADDGSVLAKYRKMHPFLHKCFQTPATNLVTFKAPFANGTTFGVFTCKDILYSSPGPALAKEGIKVFTYSAAIPVVGATAVQLWSKTYDATMIYSDLNAGMGGVYQRGSRLTPKPKSGVDEQLLIHTVTL